MVERTSQASAVAAVNHLPMTTDCFLLFFCSQSADGLTAVGLAIVKGFLLGPKHFGGAEASSWSSLPDSCSKAMKEQVLATRYLSRSRQQVRKCLELSGAANHFGPNGFDNAVIMQNSLKYDLRLGFHVLPVSEKAWRAGR